MASSSPPNYASGSPGGKGSRQWVEAMRGACDRTRDRTKGLLKKFRNSEHSMTMDAGMGRHSGPRRSVSIDMDPVTSSAEHLPGTAGTVSTVAGIGGQNNSTDSSWTVHVWCEYLYNKAAL
jgi:hypothetical protein